MQRTDDGVARTVSGQLQRRPGRGGRDGGARWAQGRPRAAEYVSRVRHLAERDSGRIARASWVVTVRRRAERCPRPGARVVWAGAELDVGRHVLRNSRRNGREMVGVVAFSDAVGVSVRPCW